MDTIEILKGRGGWYLRKKSRNGKILWHSEMYATQHNAVRAAKRERRFYRRARIRIVEAEQVEQTDRSV